MKIVSNSIFKVEVAPSRSKKFNLSSRIRQKYIVPQEFKVKFKISNSKQLRRTIKSSLVVLKLKY